ncbi:MULTISPECIES: LapA family protein [Spirulina sp. CCY15215]|uniref:lipopolysaccharide assembly protein LapA domain-containing protein n=1 Tax=Spirulina sp. CCY15215 TaxID=2767591 RepID=UPI00194EBA7A|nr:LapA family protein [Spirulina major]
MRQINFLLIFLFSLAIGLFCLENIELVTIQLIPGFKVQAPLSVELILTLGVGATLAWLFSVWVKLQRQILSLQDLNASRSKDKRIIELEKDIKRYKQELETQLTLPPSKK